MFQTQGPLISSGLLKTHSCAESILRTPSHVISKTVQMARFLSSLYLKPVLTEAEHGCAGAGVGKSNSPLQGNSLVLRQGWSLHIPAFKLLSTPAEESSLDSVVWTVTNEQTARKLSLLFCPDSCSNHQRLLICSNWTIMLCKVTIIHT